MQNIIGPMLFPNGGGVASGMGELATHLVQLLQPAGAHQQPQQQAQVRAINENEPSTSEGLGTPKGWCSLSFLGYVRDHSLHMIHTF